MTELPLTVNKYRKAKFAKWLKARGAEVLAPTNEWEVMRFRANGRVSVIYMDKAGRLSWMGEARKAYQAYLTAAPWSAKRQRQRRAKREPVLIRSIRERDGASCFYCRRELAEHEATLEHMVPVAHGGPNHLSNYVLACDPCNREAGHLSAAEKVALRESKATTTEEEPA